MPTIKQIETRTKIRLLAPLFGVDPDWAEAISYIESSYGNNQKSPTGCRGVFQMSSIAMKDLLLEMERKDDDLIDIACGILFLRLLLRRHKTIEKATERYCDPADRSFYVPHVLDLMQTAKKATT